MKTISKRFKLRCQEGGETFKQQLLSVLRGLTVREVTPDGAGSITEYVLKK
jgi:hypothetical protein